MSFFILRIAQAFLSCTADVWRSFDFSRSKKPDRRTRVPCQTWRLDTPEIACVEQHFFIRHENIILHLAILEASCLWKQHKNTNLNSQLHRFIKVVQGMTWVFRCSFMNLASGQVKGHLFEAKCQMIPMISGVARLHQEETQQRSVERSGSRPENVQKLMSHLESSWHVWSFSTNMWQSSYKRCSSTCLVLPSSASCWDLTNSISKLDVLFLLYCLFFMTFDRKTHGVWIEWLSPVSSLCW